MSLSRKYCRNKCRIVAWWNPILVMWGKDARLQTTGVYEGWCRCAYLVGCELAELPMSYTLYSGSVPDRNLQAPIRACMYKTGKNDVQRKSSCSAPVFQLWCSAQYVRDLFIVGIPYAPRHIDWYCIWSLRHWCRQWELQLEIAMHELLPLMCQMYSKGWMAYLLRLWIALANIGPFLLLLDDHVRDFSGCTGI